MMRECSNATTDTVTWCCECRQPQSQWTVRKLHLFLERKELAAVERLLRNSEEERVPGTWYLYSTMGRSMLNDG